MAYYTEALDFFPQAYLQELRTQIMKSQFLAKNNLNGDFVGTRGFSIVFRRSAMDAVKQRFPWAAPYMDALLDPACNAFYLNPLVLGAASRVDPHIDRSLRSYCKTVETPVVVSVLYVALPADLRGGELVLRRGKSQVGRIVPVANKVVRFQGDLTHLVTPVAPDVAGERLSLVCEQYALEPRDLASIPELGLESKGAALEMGGTPAPRRGRRG
ncbi:MAG: hypothetical protein JWM80_408 [Cyanobacteria bacterium RYN_339]|nr:hypothetical protein [Cyanobacteria bacterium RYN_339]